MNKDLLKDATILFLIETVLMLVFFTGLFIAIANDQKKVIENGVCSCKFCKENN